MSSTVCKALEEVNPRAKLDMKMIVSGDGGDGGGGGDCVVVGGGDDCKCWW